MGKRRFHCLWGGLGRQFLPLKQKLPKLSSFFTDTDPAGMQIRTSDFHLIAVCFAAAGWGAIIFRKPRPGRQQTISNFFQRLPKLFVCTAVYEPRWQPSSVITCQETRASPLTSDGMTWGESWCCANIQTNQAAKANFTSETDKKHQNAIYERWGIVEYALFYRWGGLQCWSVKLWDVTSRF